MLPPSEINLNSFLFANDDLLRLDGESSAVSQALQSQDVGEGKYAWEGEPAVPWCWTEDVWCTRLFHSLKEADTFRGIKLHAAFNWTSGNYIQKIATLFPNVKALRVSPFHGMTDIILQSRSLGLVTISEPSVCCVEVGVIKTGTCSFSLRGTEVRRASGQHASLRHAELRQHSGGLHPASLHYLWHTHSAGH